MILPLSKNTGITLIYVGAMQSVCQCVCIIMYGSFYLEEIQLSHPFAFLQEADLVYPFSSFPLVTFLSLQKSLLTLEGLMIVLGNQFPYLYPSPETLVQVYWVFDH